MTQYTSPHDEPWFSDPDQPWGGSHKRIERDPDYERDLAIDDALTDSRKSFRGIHYERVDGKLQVKRDPERHISETERKWREENGVA
jgi:hypothetical protein